VFKNCFDFTKDIKILKEKLAFDDLEVRLEVFNQARNYGF